MGHFAVSAIGRDRPGIVASIARGLLAVDGNVEDSRMTIVGGHFAVMLIVSTPDDRTRNSVEASLAQSIEGLGLEAVTVAEVNADSASKQDADHVITVYGSDHPGIVHAVSTELAAAGVNIVDLQTQLGGSSDSPLYVMMLEVQLGSITAAELDDRLAPVAESAAVEVEVRPLEAEAL